MSRALLAWIGKTDLRATSSETADIGPIAQALGARAFDHVVLLNNMPKDDAATFERWLRKRVKAPIVVRQYTLSSPTHYADIYRAATDAAAWTLTAYSPKTKLTFHLSQGTPAMAAILIIIAKTRF